MAKASAKKTTEGSSEKPVKAKAATTKAKDIEQVSVAVLEKLKSLNLDPQLQADLEWCLGSYSFDKNPVGLYEMGDRALEVFKAELAKKSKGVTAKFVTDLEKAIKQ